MTGRQRAVCWSLLASMLLAQAPVSFACPVCFGDSDEPIIKGLEMSILFMIVTTYFLIIGGVVCFFLLRRRARRLTKQPVDGLKGAVQR